MTNTLMGFTDCPWKRGDGVEQLESILMKCVEETISEKIDVLIEKAENDFHKKLVDRKDEYIAEVMRGIRMAHEYNHKMMCVDYRILFVNKCQVNSSEKLNN